MPPFNKINGVPIPDTVRPFSVPVFGPNILNSIMDIFVGSSTASQIHDLANELEVKIPPYALSDFLQKKIVRVRVLLDVARTRQDCAGVPNSDAIVKCERWIEAFHELNRDAITNLAAWHSFVEKHVQPGWQQKLHFDKVLSNFGFLDDTAKELAKHPYEDDGKQTTLEQHCLRWLAKSFSGYGPIGCLTDVANLVFAMENDTPPSNASEADVVACMQTFANRLHAGHFEGLWIPEVLVMDCELDDMLSWLLLEYIFRRTNQPNKLKVLAQLPTDPDLDVAHGQLGRLGLEVFRDVGSRNAEAVKSNFASKA